jgi:hypothetical protein
MGRVSRYDWDAMRADSATLTLNELVDKYDILPTYLAARRSRDKKAGDPWPECVKADPPQRVDAGAKKRQYLEERGLPVPASCAARLEPVPDAAINLPVWTSYPKDPNTARLLAEMLDKAARGEFTRSLGDEAVAFFTSHAAYLRSIADRIEQQSRQQQIEPMSRRGPRARSL